MLVIHQAFGTYEVSARTIAAMQTFIYEEALGQGELDEADLPKLEGSMTVEEYKTKRFVDLPINEFLLEVKYPRDLWAYGVWE